MKIFTSAARARRYASLGAIPFIVGCAATTVTTVKVPVPVPCQEAVPTRPAMPTDSLKPGASLYTIVQSARAEIGLRERYEHQLLAALSGCVAPVAPP